MAPPLIGLTTYAEPASWGAVWRDVPCALLPNTYLRQVREAGGQPVMLPPGDPATAAGLIGRLDALVVTGGPDVDPARYGEAAHPRTGPSSPARDAWEFALTEAALQARLPLLGICRGMQLVNVVCGGSLLQHLPEAVGHQGHSPEPGGFPPHSVRVLPGTALAKILGVEGAGAGGVRAGGVDHGSQGTESLLSAPTHHHQGVNRIGAGLRVSAVAEDGLPEALEGGDSGFVLAVQWHPEQGTDPRVLRALVTAATRRREAPGGQPRTRTEGCSPAP
jgi:putative glutamine amidotransferase